MVLYAVCAGVAVGAGLLRIGYGVPLLWLLVPGYALVLAIMWISEEAFVSKPPGGDRARRGIEVARQGHRFRGPRR